MTDLNVQDGYILWRDTNGAGKGFAVEASRGRQDAPIVVRRYGDFTSQTLSPSFQSDFIKFLQQGSAEGANNLSQNLYRIFKNIKGLQDGKPYNAGLTPKDFKDIQTTLEKSANTGVKGDSPDVLNEAAAAWALSILPAAAKNLTGKDMFSASEAKKIKDDAIQRLGELKGVALAAEKETAENKLPDEKFKKDGFALTPNENAFYKYAMYPTHFTGEGASIGEILEVSLTGGNPFKITHRKTNAPDWQDKDYLTTKGVLNDVYHTNFLDPVKKLIENHAKAAKRDKVTVADVEAVEIILRRHAQKDSNIAQRGIYANTLYYFADAVKELASDDPKDPLTLYLNKKDNDQDKTTKGDDLDAEGKNIMDALIAAEDELVKQQKPTPLMIAPRATATAPAAPEATKTSKTTVAGTPATRVAASGPAQKANGDALDIQSILNLTVKGSDPQWVDGKYDFRTNAAAGTYLEDYKAKHKIPDEIVNGYKPNNNGVMQAPVDAAWLGGFHKFLVEDRLKTDLQFRMNILETAEATAKTEIKKLHPDGKTRQTNHDYDDIRSLYVVLNLLGVKQKDGSAFPTPYHKRPGKGGLVDNLDAMSILSDKNRLADALEQITTKLGADHTAWSVDPENTDNKIKSLEGKINAGAEEIRQANERAGKAEKEAKDLREKPAAAPVKAALPRPVEDSGAAAARAAEARRQFNERSRANSEEFRWRAWEQTRETSSRFTQEKDRKNLREDNDGAFYRSNLNDKQRHIGVLHVAKDGTLVYMYQEKNAHIRTMDFTDERNDISGKNNLHGLHNAMFSKDIVDQANEIYQRSLAVYLRDHEGDGHAFNGGLGIVKDIKETHLLNSHYKLHIVDSNCDGIITRDEVHLVTNEYMQLKGQAKIVSAWQQTPEAIREEKTTLANATDASMLTRLGLPDDYMKQYNMRALYNGAASGSASSGGGGGRSPTPVVRRDGRNGQALQIADPNAPTDRVATPEKTVVNVAATASDKPVKDQYPALYEKSAEARKTIDDMQALKDHLKMDDAEYKKMEESLKKYDPETGLLRQLETSTKPATAPPVTRP